MKRSRNKNKRWRRTGTQRGGDDGNHRECSASCQNAFFTFCVRLLSAVLPFPFRSRFYLLHSSYPSKTSDPVIISYWICCPDRAAKLCHRNIPFSASGYTSARTHKDFGSMTIKLFQCWKKKAQRRCCSLFPLPQSILGTVV